MRVHVLRIPEHAGMTKGSPRIRW